jgi:hypothetical protein
VAYWQLQVPAPVMSERRDALDGLAEFEPAFELGAVCGWVAGGGWLDPEDVELEGGVELEGMVCWEVTGWEVPLSDDVLVLGEGDWESDGVFVLGEGDSEGGGVEM